MRRWRVRGNDIVLSEVRKRGWKVARYVLLCANTWIWDYYGLGSLPDLEDDVQVDLI